MANRDCQQQKAHDVSTHLCTHTVCLKLQISILPRKHSFPALHSLQFNINKDEVSRLGSSPDRMVVYEYMRFTGRSGCDSHIRRHNRLQSQADMRDKY